jgi:hypothetical protein
MALSSSKRLMRILRAIVESMADLLTIGAADISHRRRICRKPIGDDPARSTVFLHDALEQLEGRSLVPLRKRGATCGALWNAFKLIAAKGNLRKCR